MVILKGADSNINWFHYHNLFMQLWNKFVTVDELHKLLASLRIFYCYDNKRFQEDKFDEHWFSFIQIAQGFYETYPTSRYWLY